LTLTAGRRLPPMKSKMLKVRVTEEEYELLKTFAKQHNTDMSSVIRWYIKAIPAVWKEKEQTPASG